MRAERRATPTRVLRAKQECVRRATPTRVLRAKQECVRRATPTRALRAKQECAIKPPRHLGVLLRQQLHSPNQQPNPRSLNHGCSARHLGVLLHQQRICICICLCLCLCLCLCSARHLGVLLRQQRALVIQSCAGARPRRLCTRWLGRASRRGEAARPLRHGRLPTLRPWRRLVRLGSRLRYKVLLTAALSRALLTRAVPAGSGSGIPMELVGTPRGGPSVEQNAGSG